MKLKPDDYLLRQRRIAGYRAASRLRGKARASRRADDQRVRPEPVVAPKEIGLFNRNVQAELAIFLKSLRKACLAHKAVRIIFAKTEKVNCCGALLMLAEIDRLSRSLQGKCTLTCGYPKDKTVEKAFQQIGLLSLLGRQHRLEITKEDTTVANWRYASDVSVNQASADSLMKVIRAQVPAGYMKLVSGVGEAMDNAVHHAYIRPRGDQLSGIAAADERRWWVFAEVLEGWLHVAFCDLGLGIPVTLPEKWAEQIQDILRLTTLSEGKRDRNMIRRALELGRTRTKQTHRGKGLQRNILRAAEDLGGRLDVYSNMGAVGFDFRSKPPKHKESAYAESIQGTVIQWSVPLTETQVVEDEHDNDSNRQRV
ncbi:ATP-binding protein [Pseudomonas sp. HTZ2]|uniref:ATP-binding protein n=1 Tax=Pseudomonas sp. HTZ2 TaxID=3075220 RepID=UPI002958B2B0|nr:ATP-binding protein [Pseudomonas sp. HTZ2]